MFHSSDSLEMSWAWMQYFKFHKSGRRQIFVVRKSCEHKAECFMVAVTERQIKCCYLHPILPSPLHLHFKTVSIIPRLFLTYLQKTDQLLGFTQIYFWFISPTEELQQSVGLDKRPIHFVCMHTCSMRPISITSPSGFQSHNVRDKRWVMHGHALPSCAVSCNNYLENYAKSLDYLDKPKFRFQNTF